MEKQGEEAFPSNNKQQTINQKEGRKEEKR